MTTNRQDPAPKAAKTTTAKATDPAETTDGAGTPDRPAETAKEKAVAASTMEAAPEDQTGPTGTSFYNPATVGSGTIMADGTYGAPLPDPNVAKLRDQAEKNDQ